LTRRLLGKNKKRKYLGLAMYVVQLQLLKYVKICLVKLLMQKALFDAETIKLSCLSALHRLACVYYNYTE
jgi:hypothetical protein